MRIKRHNGFVKEFGKIKITDGQFEKFANYIALLGANKPLPQRQETIAQKVSILIAEDFI